MQLAIETTTHCNLSCVMCPQPTMARASEHMDRGLFESIVRQASGVVEFAWLHLFGEPLMNPGFVGLARYACEHGGGMSLGVSTNVTLLRGRVAEELSSVPLATLLLSIDGITAESYERTRVGGDFVSVLENVLRFGELYEAAPRSARPVDVWLSYIELPGFEDTDRAEAFWRARLPKSFQLRRKAYTHWAMQETVSVQSIVRRDGAKRARRLRGCREFSRGLVVLVDGRVVPCCNDHNAQLVLGDLRTQTLSEVWGGSKVEELRADRVLDNPLCRFCQQ